MSKVNIKELLLDLFSGYSFRTKVKHDPEGEVSVIQLKDLDSDYTEIGSSMSLVSSDSISSKYFLKAGDVLFISKGSNNYAIHFDKDGSYVAASAFFVLRPKVDKVDSRYLAWYLNQKHIQQYIKDNRAGTYVPNVNKGTIESLQIDIPPINIQKIIARISFLQNREYLLMNELMAKREQLISNQLLEFLKD
ncbi:restriction endonuclease subunit S [Ekhidna sp.]|uniref:restriction endonuclease subunit S n=1 Tax=Ekhidna sp. TaxID=2608089 RepID=UPI0032EE449D